MSGARALASARRRRAEPPNTTPPPLNPMNKQSSQRTIGDEYVPSTNSQQSTKMTPATMLLSHHKIIENLQKVIENQETAIKSQGETIDQLKSEVRECSKSIIDKLNDKIASSSLDEGNIEYYKEKLVSIEGTLTDMKKTFLRVQTFAMETNLQSVELKKRMKAMETGIEEKDNGLSDKMIENTEHIVEILLGISKKIVDEDNLEDVEEQGVEEQDVGEQDVEEQDVGEQGVEEQDVEEQGVEEQDVGGQGVEEQDVEEEREMSEVLNNISNKIVSSKDVLIEGVDIDDTMTFNIE